MKAALYFSGLKQERCSWLICVQVGSVLLSVCNVCAELKEAVKMWRKFCLCWELSSVFYIGPRSDWSLQALGLCGASAPERPLTVSPSYIVSSVALLK